ncbi:unnamed protein product, partial [Phaeothamnion confervicola]
MLGGSGRSDGGISGSGGGMHFDLQSMPLRAVPSAAPGLSMMGMVPAAPPWVPAGEMLSWQRMEALSARCMELEGAYGAMQEELRGKDTALAAMHQRVTTAAWQAEEYRSILDRCPDMIIAFASEGGIQFVSETCATVLQYQPAELAGADVGGLVPEAGRKEFRARLAQQMVLQSRRPLERRERVFFQQFLRRDGRPVWMEGVGQAWQRGTMVQFVMSFRELGEEASAAGRIAQSLDEARTVGLEGKPA